MTDKDQRQAAIAKLVRSRSIRTQSDLIDRLEAKGQAVDQSTLSRDLAELGITKLGGVYVLAGEKKAPAKSVDVSGAVTGFTGCGPNLILVRTGIGQAQLVAVHIDGSGESSIAGTIAGDDTILIAVKSQKAQTVALRRLKQWFGEKHGI